MTPLLSVLIPSIPRRRDKLNELLTVLGAMDHPMLEVLVLLDNCRRPVGHKRNALMTLARGEFICHIDDDELVTEDFTTVLLPLLGSINETVDVVAYDAEVTIDGGTPFRVHTALGNPVEAVTYKDPDNPAAGYADIKRPPWHWCAWRREVALKATFPDFYYGEDWHWLSQMYPLVRVGVDVGRVLFKHRFSTTDSSGSHHDTVSGTAGPT